MNLDDLYSIMKNPPDLKLWQRFKNFLDGTLNWLECWEWQGGCVTSGYGSIMEYSKPKKHYARVHRLMALWVYGDGGQCVDHVVCDNRLCVNPLHILPTTYQFNNSRAGASFINSRKTHCKNGHEFTPENLSTRPSDIGRRRRCLTCAKNLKK